MQKISSVLLTTLMLLSFNLNAQDATGEILTLFTTQQERALIDNNRYKVVRKTTKSAPVVQVEEPERKTIYKQVVLNLKVSGITLTQDGRNLAWVDGRAYENGAALEDGSKVYISRKARNLVQIKTPDGKYHNVVTGKSSEIKYLKPVQG